MTGLRPQHYTNNYRPVFSNKHVNLVVLKCNHSMDDILSKSLIIVS